MATIGSKWSLVPKNGWNKVEQGWNGIGGIRTDHFDHFATPLMAILGPQEVKKMGPNGSILLLFGPNGLWCPKMVGTSWNKVGMG